MPNAHECAQLLLETVPKIMRGFGEAMRQCRRDEDDQLTMGQLRMLGILQAAPRTLGALAALHHVTPSTMSRTVDVLVRKSWVERRNDPNDRRQVILTLTPEGAAAHAAIGQEAHLIMTQTVERQIERLDDAERARLYDGLSVLRKVLDNPGDEGC